MGASVTRLQSALRAQIIPLIRRGFMACGRSWNDFYAWIIDFQERRTTLDDILRRPPTPERGTGLYDWWRGDAHLAFMRRHGLGPEHRVLDFGCGYGRTSIPLIRFLDPGNLVGVELSDRRAGLARDWVARENLGDRKPEFIVRADNALSWLADRSIDVIWTLSVFNHMPDAELRTCLRAVRRVLKPGGRLFFYFTVPLDDGQDAAIRRSGSGAFAYFPRSEERVRSLLAEFGLEGRNLAEWDADLGKTRAARARMFLVTRRGEAAGEAPASEVIAADG